MKTRAGKNRSKKLTGALLGLMIVASLTACGGSKQETANPSVSESVETAAVKETTAATVKVAVKETTAATVKVAVKETTAAAVVEKPSGIQDDGMGPDPNYGEGIGEVIALSDSERAYVQEQTTNSWLAMEKMEKSDLVALMARLLEETKDYIVEDFDDLEYMLDRQMEQYFRNGVNEGVYNTVLDILGLASSNHGTGEKPSGIQDDGMGPDPNYGEGIGEVIALSDSERTYVQEQTTNSWLAMEKMEKSDLVALMARLLEETKDYIVEDFDDLEYMLDRQMEQYFRNGVNEGVYDTVLDILGLK